MTTNDEDDALARGLAAIDDEMIAEIEEGVPRRPEAGEATGVPERRDDGADPLGIDWAWATVSDEAPAGNVQPEAAAASAVRNLKSPRIVYIAGGFLAACVLVGLVILAGPLFRDRGHEDFVLKVKPTKRQFLGTDRPEPTFDESPMGGFVCALSVTREGAVRVWPSEGDRPGTPVPIAANASFRVGPLPEDTDYVVVVVTEQPATATLIQSFGRKRRPADTWPDLGKQVTSVLREQRYRNVAVGGATYPPRP